MINPTVPPESGRGCGHRDPGMPYLCMGLSPFGSPIESFVIDPVIPWPGEFQRGMKILPRNSKDPSSVNDVIVFVGSDDYKSAWAFVEEARHFGISRKASPTFPFDKLTPGESRMVFVHRKAIPQFPYKLDREPRPLYGCKSFQAWVETHYDGPPEQHGNSTPCTFALRDLAVLCHPAADVAIGNGEAHHFRIDLPSFHFYGHMPSQPESGVKLPWQIGIFLAAPLSHIEFVRKIHPKAKERAKAAGFETIVMEQ